MTPSNVTELSLTILGIGDKSKKMDYHLNTPFFSLLCKFLLTLFKNFLNRKVFAV